MVDPVQTDLAKKIFGDDIVIAVTDYHEHSGLAAGVDLIADPNAEIEGRDGLTIHFTNGRAVRFSTSEWATIQQVDAAIIFLNEEAEIMP